MANFISPPDIFQGELALNPIFNQPKSQQHTISHANEFESPDLRMLGVNPIIVKSYELKRN